VFSPYYALARRSGAAEPLDYCALNVALYGKGSRRWALTERARGAVRQSPSFLAIGPSVMSWDGNALSVEIDEIAVPMPRRVRGQLRLFPDAVTRRAYALDGQGDHRWRPIAPAARIEVGFQNPALRWSGSGYFDSNDGQAPLENAFVGWQWSRAKQRADTIVLYDVSRRDGNALSLALRFGSAGEFESLESPPPAVQLPRTKWLLPRTTRADERHAPRVVQTLEDAPFYARSMIAGELFGEAFTAVHESLSLDRFSTNWVKLLLPFRMPRTRR
jgi:carotenoid 1,2-hydratase